MTSPPRDRAGSPRPQAVAWRLRLAWAALLAGLAASGPAAARAAGAGDTARPDHAVPGVLRASDGMPVGRVLEPGGAQ